jgi:hypothetical protein
MEWFSTMNTRSLLAPLDSGPDIVGPPGLAVCERWVGCSVGEPELAADAVGPACPELLVAPQPVSINANDETATSTRRARPVTPSDVTRETKYPRPDSNRRYRLERAAC